MCTVGGRPRWEVDDAQGSGVPQCGGARRACAGIAGGSRRRRHGNRVRPDRRLSGTVAGTPRGLDETWEPGPVGKGVRSHSGLESRDARIIGEHGESSLPGPMGDAVTTGPDVRRLYAAAVKRLVAWRDTARLLRRRSTERLREIVRQLENALLRRDAQIAAEGGSRLRSLRHLLDVAMLRSQSVPKRMCSLGASPQVGSCPPSD